MQTKSNVITKNKRQNRVISINKRLVEGNEPGRGWSFLEYADDSEAAWPKSVNLVANAACKTKTADEIWHQIGKELENMGVASVFLVKEPADEKVLTSISAFSSGALKVYPNGAAGTEKPRYLPSDSEIIRFVFASGDAVLTSSPEESLKRLFLPIARNNEAVFERPFYIVAPLVNASCVFGVLVAAASEINHGKAHNIALLANIASMSCCNKRMSTEMDAMRDKIENMDRELISAASALDKSLQDVVQALVAPMEKRDPYTFGHQTRVTRLAVAIAEEMGLAQDRIDGLRLASSIHDIGKIVVPFEILNRPARLSEAELNLVKMHPQVGFDMLSPITFRWPVPEIVHQHHERIDGSGYPRGLKSCQTLLEAKILAVADVVEAMSSHRPYRASLGVDAALEEVSSKSGILYESEAVSACIRLLLIKNFSLEPEIAWQSSNPFAPVKSAP
jgi:HD-GYP domain-containing protein (c-di-GMP phosphodiesterase class II)